MSEQSLFEIAMDIAQKVTSQCKDQAEAVILLGIVAQLVNIRWAISLK